MSSAWSRGLALLTVAAVAAVLAGTRPVAVAGGLLLAFALPGLGLTLALFRGRELSAVERVILAPALSLALLIVAGLVMFAAGVGLDRSSWTAATAGVTLVALLASALPARPAGGGRPAGDAGQQPALDGRAPALAAVAATRAVLVAQRPGLPHEGGSPGETTVRLRIVPSDTTGVEQPAPPTGPRRGNARQALLLSLAAVLVIGAGALSYTSARESFGSAAAVATLSATPPGPVNAAGLHTVTVTATGLHTAEQPYTLVVTGARGRRLASLDVPAAGGTWTAAIPVPGRQRVTLALYRAGQVTAYRTIIIAEVR